MKSTAAISFALTLWLSFHSAAGVAIAKPARAKVDQELNKAGFYLSTNRHDKAYTLYQNYLKKHPDSGEARAGLAWIIFQSRGFNKNAVPEALKEAEKAVKLSPKSPLAHNVLGAIYFSLGRVPEAQQEFRTVIAIDPRRKCGGCGDISGLLYAGTPLDPRMTRPGAQGKSVVKPLPTQKQISQPQQNISPKTKASGKN
ncbi:MAG: tetratricopeptide repeat protein [Cyanobacteria bacterium HKST-UBA01]|nr:tetratricopeptide repeat protein [Cyanobacteria bacterium HKST-UBA01]